MRARRRDLRARSRNSLADLGTRRPRPYRQSLARRPHPGRLLGGLRCRGGRGTRPDGDGERRGGVGTDPGGVVRGDRPEDHELRPRGHRHRHRPHDHPLRLPRRRLRPARPHRPRHPRPPRRRRGRLLARGLRGRRRRRGPHRARRRPPLTAVWSPDLGFADPDPDIVRITRAAAGRLADAGVVRQARPSTPSACTTPPPPGSPCAPPAPTCGTPTGSGTPTTVASGTSSTTPTCC